MNTPTSNLLVVKAYHDFGLCLASANGDAEIVRLFIAAGADIHADDDAALRWAAIRSLGGKLETNARRGSS